MVISKEELLEKEHIYIPDTLDQSIIIYLQMGFRVMLWVGDRPVIFLYSNKNGNAFFCRYCIKPVKYINMHFGLPMVDLQLAFTSLINDLELRNICDQIY